MFGLAVRKVVLSMLTKLRRDSSLKMTLMHGASSISIFRSRFLPTSAPEVARSALAIAI